MLTLSLIEQEGAGGGDYFTPSPAPLPNIHPQETFVLLESRNMAVGAVSPFKSVNCFPFDRALLDCKR